MLGYRLQMLNNRQMLRTHRLALTAGNAVSRSAKFLRQPLINCGICRPFLYSLPHFFIVKRKILRYRNMLRTAFRTIRTAGTWHGNVGGKQFCCFLYKLSLLFGHRLKIFHIGQVILHLL